MAAIDQFFSSYDEALASCQSGYEDPDIPLLVGRKTVAILPSLRHTLLDPDPLSVSLLSVLSAARHAEPVRVIDFGGGCGYHYFAARAILPDLKLVWHVVETAAMVAQAKVLFDVDGLRFFSELDEAVAAFGGSADLVHSSSTLQYVPAPEELLERLTGIGAALLTIARYPLFEGARTVGVQSSRLGDNGPGPIPEGTPDKIIRYPVTFSNRAEFATRLLASYDVIAQFASPSANYQVGGEGVAGGSFMLRRRG